MLVLRRKEGQWLTITHRSGDVLRIRVYGISNGPRGEAVLAFEDPDRYFDIQRPERGSFPVAAPEERYRPDRGSAPVGRPALWLRAPVGDQARTPGRSGQGLR